jgi:hypothetical protein
MNVTLLTQQSQEVLRTNKKSINIRADVVWGKSSVTFDEEISNTEAQKILANGKLDSFSANSVPDDAMTFKKLSFIIPTGIPLSYHHSIIGTAVTSTIKWGQHV